MTSPRYRWCWWCSRQLHGNAHRTVAHPSGPVTVHACCEADAVTEVADLVAPVTTTPALEAVELERDARCGAWTRAPRKAATS